MREAKNTKTGLPTVDPFSATDLHEIVPQPPSTRTPSRLQDLASSPPLSSTPPPPTMKKAAAPRLPADDAGLAEFILELAKQANRAAGQSDTIAMHTISPTTPKEGVVATAPELPALVAQPASSGDTPVRPGRKVYTVDDARPLPRQDNSRGAAAEQTLVNFPAVSAAPQPENDSPSNRPTTAMGTVTAPYPLIPLDVFDRRPVRYRGRVVAGIITLATFAGTVGFFLLR